MFAYRDQKYGSIYDIADVVYGAPFKSSLFNENGDGWPLIRIRDLSTYQPQYYTSEEHPKRTFIEPGDVVAGMDADFSPTLWLGKRAVLNQRVCEFVPPRGTAVTKSYLLCATRPLLSFIQGYATGTTVAHLGKGDLEALRVPLPREDDLLAFGNISEPMRLMIVSNSEESARLSMIRDTLLPKLMSGEIDVSKVELPTPPNNHLSWHPIISASRDGEFWDSTVCGVRLHVDGFSGMCEGNEFVKYVLNQCLRPIEATYVCPKV